MCHHVDAATVAGTTYVDVATSTVNVLERPMALLRKLWRGCRCLLSVACGRSSPLGGRLDICRMRSVLGRLWLVVCL